MPWSGQAKRHLEHLLQWNLLLMVQKQGLWIAMDLFLSLRYVLSVEIFWVCDSVTLLISLLVTFFNVILYNRYMKLGTWFLWINQKLHFRCSKAGWEGIWSNKRRLEIINVPHNFYMNSDHNYLGSMILGIIYGGWNLYFSLNHSEIPGLYTLYSC